MDQGWAWVILGANFCTSFITTGCLLTTGIVQTTLMEKYGADVAKTSWVVSIFTSLVSLTGPVGSVLINRYSCRSVVILGGLMMATGFFITAFASSIEVCILSCGFLAGFGGGIIYTVIFTVCGFNFKKRLNIAQAVSMVASGCGLLILAPVMEATRENFGHTGLFLFMSGLCLQLTICGCLMRPSETETSIRMTRIKLIKRVQDDQRVCNKVIKSVRSHFKVLGDRCVICLSLSMGAYCGGLYTMLMHWPNFCLRKGFTAMQGSYILSIIGISTIFGRMATGFISSLSCVDERLVYSLTAAITSVPLIIFQFYSQHYTGHIVSACIVGSFMGSCFVVISTINATYVGLDNLSSASGIEFFMGGIGSIVVPVVSGYCIKYGWTYDSVAMATGFCILLSSMFGFGTMCLTKDAQVDNLEITMDVEQSKAEFATLVSVDQEDISTEHQNICTSQRPKLLV